MKRRRAREYALQSLFQLDFTSSLSGAKADDLIKDFWADKTEDEAVRRFSEKLIRGTLQNLGEIDSVIEKTAEHWVLERMAAVDRNILRLSVYELLYLDEIPPAVAINEAIEIAKKYSTRDSASFINGILDRVLKAKRK
jgi:N utilization substance protein B